ncbi:TlpA disulfide reductase family protein [uncultured Thiothrix sp.]|uniref:TlpA family protein disulfide reductase n=1 Tax=uncultured Thiothrix sp. TaxID=223185 RepID=UPI002633AE51|nr:TlpA disulfide reductase family protein [uncultured Thiothrix sp.]
MLKALTKQITALSCIGLLSLSANLQAFTDLQGQSVQLAEQVGKGKWTVFEVWASDCPYCPDGVFYMKDFKARYPQADLYGISLDGDSGQIAGRQLAQGFIKKHKINFPTLMSSTLELDNFLIEQGEQALMGTPALIIYNPKGELKGVESGAIIAQDVIDFIQGEQAKNH